MNKNWAEENLQTIRTLMERSAVYRRALAPIMLFAGTMGIVAAAIGVSLHLYSQVAFLSLWLGTALFVMTGALLIARRQARRDKEEFWSPPTRRISQAMVPPLFAGMISGLIVSDVNSNIPLILPLIWALFYGCALHTAGFFVPNGLRSFGVILIGTACGFFILSKSSILIRSWHELGPHCFMGYFFGVMHIIYSLYLYSTEKKTLS